MEINDIIKRNYHVLINLFAHSYSDVSCGIYLLSKNNIEEFVGKNNKDDLKNSLNNIIKKEPTDCLYYFAPLSNVCSIYFLIKNSNYDDQLIKNSKKLFNLIALVSFDNLKFDYTFLNKFNITSNSLHLLTILLSAEETYNLKYDLINKKITLDDKLNDYFSLTDNVENTTFEDFCNLYLNSIQLKINLVKKNRISNFKYNLISENGSNVDVYLFGSNFDESNKPTTLEIIFVLNTNTYSLRDFVENAKFIENLKEPSKFGLAYKQQDDTIYMLDDNARSIFGISINAFDINEIIEINDSYNKQFTSKQIAKFSQVHHQQKFSVDLEFINIRNEYHHIEIFGIQTNHYYMDGNYYLLIVKDLILKKEELILESIELEHSLKVLAGTIAHDFNNVLMGVNVYVNLLKKEQGLSKTAQLYTDKLDYYSKTLANLSNKLLNYTTKDNDYNDWFDCISLISNIVENIRNSFPYTILFNLDMDSNQALITGNFINMKSVFMEILLAFKNIVNEIGTININTDINNSYIVDKSFTNFQLHKPRKYLEVIISSRIKLDKYSEFTKFIPTRLYQLLKDIMYKIELKKDMLIFTLLLPYYEERSFINENIIDNSQNIRNDEYNIIIIDDDPIVIEATETILEDYGFNVVPFLDPLEAITFYKQNYNNIDLVILDMIMPTLSGEEVFKSLKLINKNLKVIILSGFSQEGKVEQLLNDGALDYIKKPINVKKFIGKITNVLYQIKKIDNINYLNKEYALSMLDNNVRVYNKLLGRYYEEYQNSEHLIKNYIEKKDFLSIRNIVHKIKGLSLNLGSHILHEESSKLENDLDLQIYNDKDIYSFIELHNKILNEIKNGLE